MPPEQSRKTRLYLSCEKLVDLGLKIFQARSDKSPATKRGFKDASADAEQIFRWRDNALAASPTGPENGTVVIDLDVSTEKNVNGLQWLADMEAVNGELPPHPIARTPRGGEHHYFKYPEGALVRCSAGKLAPGVDVRGNGGYVIVPDSETTVGSYRWEIAPWNVSPPEMPRWLLEKVTDGSSIKPAPLTSGSPSPKVDQEAVGREVEKQLRGLQSAKPGTRNHLLNVAAFRLGKIVGADALDEVEIHRKLLDLAREIGLPESEARATIRSGLNAGKQRPWRPSTLDEELRRINRDYFFSTEGKTAVVFREDHDPVFGNRILSRLHPGAFRDQFGNQYVMREMPNGSIKPAKLGHAWLDWVDRRQYDKVTFVPGRSLPKNIYNQWQGFGADCAKGDCSPFLSYMRDVLCEGDEELFEYLVGWCAVAVQQPWKPGEVAVVLRGNKGTGKTFFAHHFGELFGDHFVELTNSRHLTGNFNAHLETAVLVFADEAFWAGDKPGESTLKALITSDRILIERKGVDARPAPNYIHLIIASNADWAVPASVDERRFFVLNVSHSRKEDHGYFKWLEEQWQSGVREALLHHLTTLDISQFNVRLIPKTAALLEQKLMSLGSVDRWYFDALKAGKFDLTAWDEWLSTADLYDRLIDVCKKQHLRPPSMEAFGMRLSVLVPARAGCRTARVQRMVAQKREWGYELGSLDICRAHFEKVLGFPIEWETSGELQAGRRRDSGIPGQ